MTAGDPRHQLVNAGGGIRLRRLALETICASWLAAAVARTIQTLIWNREERLLGSLEKYHWLPVYELPGYLTLMPFGFLIYSFHPAGWLFWLGFGSTLWNRSREFIVVAVAGAIWFGIKWPWRFQVMLGI